VALALTDDSYATRTICAEDREAQALLARRFTPAGLGIDPALVMISGDHRSPEGAMTP